MEVPLFQQFVISASGFLCDDDCLVELISQLSNVISQSFAFDVLGWDFSEALYFGVLLLEFVPLLLEVLESFVHLVFNEEIPEEEVEGNSSGFTGN